MSETFKYFNESKYYSTKHKKYFDVYDELFSQYKNKKITFVEIGILNGGSLNIWKKFFGENARIIGIDYNPECKKLESEGYEIFIGNQADENFWDTFFEKVGDVDIVLDDGGHTNHQQISTTIKCIPYIKDQGKMVIEDIHTSYQSRFGNPSKYSFINFCKKLIDDVNSITNPNYNNFKFSLNKYIYSINFYESFCVFNINRSKCVKNTMLIKNGKKISNSDDYRYNDSSFLNFLKTNFSFLLKIKLFKIIIKYQLLLLKYLLNKKNIIKYKKYFK